MIATHSRLGLWTYDTSVYFSEIWALVCTEPVASGTTTNGAGIKSENPSEETPWLFILLGVIGFLALLLIAAFVSIACIVKRKKNNSSFELTTREKSAMDGIIIKEELGSGQFGRVYRGLWQGNEVALKTIPGGGKALFREAALLQFG